MGLKNATSLSTYAELDLTLIRGVTDVNDIGAESLYVEDALGRGVATMSNNESVGGNDEDEDLPDSVGGEDDDGAPDSVGGSRSGQSESIGGRNGANTDAVGGEDDDDEPDSVGGEDDEEDGQFTGPGAE